MLRARSIRGIRGSSVMRCVVAPPLVLLLLLGSPKVANSWCSCQTGEYVSVRENQRKEFECEAADYDKCTGEDEKLYICISTTGQFFDNDEDVKHTWEIGEYAKVIGVEPNISNRSVQGCEKKAINIGVVPTVNHTSQLNGTIPIVNGSTLYCIIGVDNHCAMKEKILNISSKTYILRKGTSPVNTSTFCSGELATKVKITDSYASTVTSTVTVSVILTSTATVSGTPTLLPSQTSAQPSAESSRSVALTAGVSGSAAIIAILSLVTAVVLLTILWRHKLFRTKGSEPTSDTYSGTDSPGDSTIINHDTDS